MNELNHIMKQIIPQNKRTCSFCFRKDLYAIRDMNNKLKFADIDGKFHACWPYQEWKIAQEYKKKTIFNKKDSDRIKDKLIKAKEKFKEKKEILVKEKKPVKKELKPIPTNSIYCPKNSEYVTIVGSGRLLFSVKACKQLDIKMLDGTGFFQYAYVEYINKEIQIHFTKIKTPSSTRINPTKSSASFSIIKIFHHINRHPNLFGRSKYTISYKLDGKPVCHIDLKPQIIPELTKIPTPVPKKAPVIPKKQDVEEQEFPDLIESLQLMYLEVHDVMEKPNWDLTDFQNICSGFENIYKEIKTLLTSINQLPA